MTLKRPFMVIMMSIVPMMPNDGTDAPWLLSWAEEPLSCPMLALGGEEDPRVPASEIGEWSRFTTGAFEHRYVAVSFGMGNQHISQ
jgi:surfactin synthase thioesterase subunit